LLFHRVLSVQLTLGLLFPLFSQTQQPTGTTSQQRRNQSLKIFVLQGEGAINDIRTGASTAPVIEVRDQNDQPVEGATVTFELPSSGPSALLQNGKLNLTTRTNAQGQAGATGFIANDQTGQFKIKVAVSFGTQSAATVITQTNSTRQFALSSRKQKGISKKWWILAGAVAAGAATGGVLATRGGSTAVVALPTATITPFPGPVVVGGPK
jgi:hypothetical protein